MSYSSEVLADSPSCWYRLNESSGAPQDSSGNSRHMDQVNGSPAGYQATGLIATDTANKAVNFDGADDYFSVPDANWNDATYIFDGTNNRLLFTIEAWIKPDALTADMPIYFKGTNGIALFVRASDDRVVLTKAGAPDQDIVWSTPLTAGVTYHVVLVLEWWTHLNYVTRKIYLNGVDATAGTGTPTLQDTGNRMRIGSRDNGTYFDGTIDEVAFYSDKALTATRVLAHYNAAIAAPIYRTLGTSQTVETARSLGLSKLTAGFELGTDGATIATTDPGNANPWTTVFPAAGAGATLQYDDDGPKRNNMSCKIGTVASGGPFMRWDSGAFGTRTDHYGRIYVYFTANPSSAVAIVSNSSSGTLRCRIVINTDGTVSFLDSTLAEIFRTTNSINLNAWTRIEWHILHHTTSGQVELRLYNNPDSNTVTDSRSSGAINTGASSDQLTFGIATNAPNIGPFWVDDIGGGATTWLGPSTPPIERTLTPAVVADTAQTLAREIRLTLTDSITLSDSLTTSVTKVRTLSDSITLADATARAKTIPKPLADNINLSDATARAKTIPKSIADSLTLADTTTRAKTIPKSVADPITLADATTRAKTAPKSLTDTVVLADSFSRVAPKSRTLPDNVSVSDNVTAGESTAYTRQVNDTLALADSCTPVHTPGSVAYTRSPADTVVVADAGSITWDVDRRTSHVISVSDSVTTKHVPPLVLTPATVANAARPLSITKTIRKTLAVPAVVDSARTLSVTKPIRRTLVAAVVADSAQAVPFTKKIFKSLVAATSGNVAQTRTVTKPIVKVLTRGPETDTARTLTFKQASDFSITNVTEAESARALVVIKTIRKSLVAATSVASARPLSITKTIFKALALATSPSAAQPLSRSRGKTLAPPATAETARSLSVSKKIFKSLGAATFVQVAQPLIKQKGRTLAPAVQASAAVTLDKDKFVVRDKATEVDEAVSLSVEAGGPTFVSINKTTMLHEARPLTFVKIIRKTLAPASEVDTARTLSAIKPILKFAAPAMEANTARVLTHSVRVVIGSVTENTLSIGLTYRVGNNINLGSITEVTHAIPLTWFYYHILSPAEEHDNAQKLSQIREKYLTWAIEHDYARALHQRDLNMGEGIVQPGRTEIHRTGRIEMGRMGKIALIGARRTGKTGMGQMGKIAHGHSGEVDEAP